MVKRPLDLELKRTKLYSVSAIVVGGLLEQRREWVREEHLPRPWPVSVLLPRSRHRAWSGRAWH